MSKADKTRRETTPVDPVEAALRTVDAARRAREKAEAAEQAAVVAAREAGSSWGRIGELYGLTKQGAQQRFKQPRPSVEAEPAPDVQS